MSRFQQGSLFKLERKSRPDVWVFRWYDFPIFHNPGAT